MLGIKSVESRVYKLTFFVFSVLEVLLCSGIMFGWTSIVVVFKDKGFFYADECNVIAANAKKVFNECTNQMSMLNMVFSVALFTPCLQFPAGILVDRIGPKNLRIITGSIYIAACIGMGFVENGSEMWLFPVFVGMSFGGGILLITVLKVSNTVFGSAKARVICILNGAFDSSAVIMLLFKIVYEKGYSLRDIMLVYGALSFVLIFFGTFILVPGMELLTYWSEEQSPQEPNERESIIQEGHATIKYDAIPTKISPETKHLPDNKGLRRSIFSRLYLLEVYVMMAVQLKLSCYVGSLQDYLVRITHNDIKQVSTYVNLFGYIQFGGILVTPLVGLVFDKNNISSTTRVKNHLKEVRSSILPYFILVALTVLFSVLGLVQSIKVEVPSYVLYMVVRGFLFACHGAFVGVAFPPEQFATLFGLGISLASAATFLQYPLFAVTNFLFHGNNFWVNMLLLLLSVLCIAHPLHLLWYCRDRKQPQDRIPLVHSRNSLTNNTV